MKTLKIIVRGRVQKVGYRRLVDEIAFDLGITGYVRNLEDKKTVEIIAQHENDAILHKFVERIKITDYPIRVDKVESSEMTEPVRYAEFEVIEGPIEIENRESLEAGAIYMRKLANEMRKLTNDTGDVKNETKDMKNEIKVELRDTRVELGGKLDHLATEITKRFDTVDVKYDRIS
ncbi:MAG: acylphosphatase, partial [Candidatus Bilamarchaeaceae archaeon]